MAKFITSISTATLALSLVTIARFASAAVNTDPSAPTEAPRLPQPSIAGAERSGPTATPEPWRAPESLNLSARAFMVPTLGMGGLGWGLDEAYSVIPNLAIGGQYWSYFVDQGADPEYCARCIRSGQAAFAFAEGRLWPARWFTPYARAGGGLSFVNGQRVPYDGAYGETDFTLLSEAGLELHHRWFSSRVFAFHLEILGSKLDEDPFSGFGAQLGARF